MKVTLSASFIPDRPLVLVGMMGSGKSAVGRKLAARLGVLFVDSDAEIERAAAMTIAQIFDRYGEPEFRTGERRVMERLLNDKPSVVSTGGGAFMDPDTRALIGARAISIWLKADIETLLTRTGRRDDRPLLRGGDPRAIMTSLLAEREPVYATATIVVASDDRPIEDTVDRIIEALHDTREAGKKALLPRQGGEGLG